MEMQEQVPLAPLTTFHIGGSARFFVRANTLLALKKAFEFVRTNDVKVLVLGGGSNVLLPDEDFEGLVIKIELKGITIEASDTSAALIAGAGEQWDTVAERAIAENLWGIENLSGIPGSVGGAVVQNIGAYGAALSDVLSWVEVLDSEDGEIKKLSAHACALGYRDSFFKHDGGRHIVLRAALSLSRAPKPNLSYRDLKEFFSDSSLDLNAIREAVLVIRTNKFPDLALEGTAGSFFKNPVMPRAAARTLQTRFPTMPIFTLPESSDIKIPLGWLLDYRHGVMDARAFKVGGARMYEKQFLVIVAQKNCTASDVRELAQRVQREVREKIGIDIEPEVRIV